MKKLISILISGIILCSFQVNAQQIKVNCTIELNGTYQPDSVFTALYPTRDNYFQSGVNPPNPVFFEKVSNNKLSFEAEPGIYMIGTCAWKYSRPYRLIYLNPGMKSINLKFIMNPQPIGYGHILDNIEKVELTGDFNSYNPQKTVQLEKQNNVWKLSSTPPALKIDQKYHFVVNGENTDDLLNDDIVVDKVWLTFNNIYKGNEIVFDPSVYLKQENYSWVVIENPSTINEQLDSLGLDLAKFNKFYQETQRQIFRKSEEERKKSADSILSGITDIENKYDPGFRQLFIEKMLEIQLIKLISVNPGILSASQEQMNEFLASEKFKTLFSEYLDLLNELDPNSYMLEGSFTQSINLMKNLVSRDNEIMNNFKISPEYFDEFATRFIQNSLNERMSCNVLYQMAIIQINTDPDKAKSYLDQLSKYEYEKYIPKERVTQMYTQFNVKIGKYAPDFAITTLEGNEIKLSDFKGKFVFIDFWGSWCKPCLNELPNIKNLHTKVSREKLEIIGIAGNDKEESLRKCIAENGIGYTNAMATGDLLMKYGIRKYPTSLLLNPKGRIIRMDMRGLDEINLIADEIEDYFK